MATNTDKSYLLMNTPDNFKVNSNEKHPSSHKLSHRFQVFPHLRNVSQVNTSMPKKYGVLYRS